MYCRNCGNEIPNNAKFCSQCGTIVKKSKTGLIITLVSVFVFVGGGIGFIGKHLLFDNNIRFDENNIGEVYYAQIDPDHVSETDIGTLYADNELLIVANEKASYDDVEKIIKGYNGEIVGWIEQTGDFQIKFPDTYSISELEQISAKISKNKLINSSNPNYIVEYANDDFYGFEFGKEWEQDLQAFDYLGKSWGWEVIRTFDAWWYMDKIKTNGNSMDPIRVGLIDCGFDESHEDLEFAEVHYNKTAIDREHGTHVAGTMAAISDNKIGICGVYPYGKNNLYAVADGGSSNYGGVSKYAENGTFWSSAMGQKIAFSELILRDVKVINQSMGFNLYQSDYFKNKFGSIDYKALKKFWNDSSNFNDDIENAKILGDFLHRLIENGHEFVIISAAGNDSDKSIGHLESKYSSWNNMIRYEDYPDVFNRIIVVGAVNKQYNMSSFSNAGSRVDVFAPGETIFSTVSNDKYDNKNGTSMAAPHVSGVAALVWTVNNDLTGAEVKSIICDDSNRSNVVKSCKMIDAYNCVVAASNTKKNTKLYDKKNGGVLNFVVDKEDESIRIEGAKVTALKGSEVISIAQTDQYGHFELILPAGTYDIIIEKEPYETYTWSNITVKAGEVNYLSDWTKLELEKIMVELPNESENEVDFDVIKQGRYENDKIKVDVTGTLNEVGKIRIEYNLDDSHVSVANYEGTLKQTLDFKASDWFGENSYSIVFDNESLHIVIQENPAWNQAAAISLPKADAELNYTTSDIPNYDISSWSDEMIVKAINQYLKSTEEWNECVVFSSEVRDNSVMLRYQGGKEANTLTNFMIIWGKHEDYAQIGYYGSDVFKDIFHLTEYTDNQYTKELISTNEWKKAYYSILINYLNDDSQIKVVPAFDLYDIDDDGVPELFITSNSAHYCDEFIYTYDNGDTVLLEGCYSDYGTWAAGNGYLFGYHDINGGYQAHSLYKKDGTKLIIEYSFTSDYGAVPENEAEFCINDVVVSKEEYENKIGDVLSDTTAVGRQYELNNQTIDSVLGTTPILYDETNKRIGTVITEKDDLNVRASSSTSSDIIGKVPKGGKVSIVADEGDWYKIDYNGDFGFVLKQYVSLFDDSRDTNSISGVTECLKKGTINSKGAKYVYSYTSEYVCKGGNKTEERLDLEHGWHITAKNTCTAYDIVWYELWDTDDGDYYGWVDSDFISFYQ